MKPVFADTVYFLALLNPADQFYPRARALSLELHSNQQNCPAGLHLLQH